MLDVLPDLSPEDGAPPTTELRTRVFVERQQEIGEHLRLQLSGYVDGLVADRARDAVVRPNDLYIEYRADRFDVRAGYSRIVWGRLDEFQPTDVVNPIDLTRFLLEGRSEARLPAALVRGRVFLSDASTIEAVVAPVFRASTFDQLDEETSPFNPAPPVARNWPEPQTSWDNLQGGGRFTSTVGRVDWGVSAYRGFRTFPTYPRSTMIGGDVETARGPWGLRGEVAVFLEEDAVEAGVGADRRAGDYRIAANVLVTTGQAQGTDVLLVSSAERSFARETRRIRAFAVYDPTDDTAFARLIAAVSVRDNVWVEGSAGVFAGSSLDTIGLLTRRDFLYARLKVFF
jgi:hypothetical protein